MPSAPPRECSRPTCHTLVTGGGPCPEHAQERQQQADAARSTASQRGYDGKWREARAAFLAAHPLCAEHQREGKTVAAVVVDHKIPHKGDKRLFWDRANWQSLCSDCHNAKTAREDGGFGNRLKGSRLCA